MPYSLIWLPDVLTAAGLQVVEVPGWQTRGHGDFGPAKGVLLHHTAGLLVGNMPSLDTLVHGRPDLSGPLCNLGLGRDGSYFIVAAGRAYHAGEAEWQGITECNTELIGIEAENTGLPNDTPWPDVQMQAYYQGVAALLTHIGAPLIMCAGHKEVCIPKGRKDDPDFSMDDFRQQVDALMVGNGDDGSNGQ